MSPTLNGSAALQRFEQGNAVEIRNGIMSPHYDCHIYMYIHVVGSKICETMIHCLSKIFHTCTCRFKFSWQLSKSTKQEIQVYV